MGLRDEELLAAAEWAVLNCYGCEWWSWELSEGLDRIPRCVAWLRGRCVLVCAVVGLVGFDGG